MSVKDWADFFNDNRIGPLLRELGVALEECEDPELIRKATKMMVNMGYSAQTMLHHRAK
jgi:fructosamine-3-kinase